MRYPCTTASTLGHNAKPLNPKPSPHSGTYWVRRTSQTPNSGPKPRIERIVPRPASENASFYDRASIYTSASAAPNASIYDHTDVPGDYTSGEFVPESPVSSAAASSGRRSGRYEPEK